jgi:hypothetical protein
MEDFRNSAVRGAGHMPAIVDDTAVTNDNTRTLRNLDARRAWRAKEIEDTVWILRPRGTRVLALNRTL